MRGILYNQGCLSFLMMGLALLGWEPSARSDESSSPLAEMRIAAAAAAEVDPAALARTLAPLTKELVRAEIRAAIREEVRRESAPRPRIPARRQLGSLRDDRNTESVRESQAQARGAALQAEQARLNRQVMEQREMDQQGNNAAGNSQGNNAGSNVQSKR